MKYSDFLPSEEEIIFVINTGYKETFGYTERRFFLFNKYGRKIKYQDMPLEKISGFDNEVFRYRSLIWLLMGLIILTIDIIVLCLTIYSFTLKPEYLHGIFGILKSSFVYVIFGMVFLLTFALLFISMGLSWNFKSYVRIFGYNAEWEFFTRDKNTIKLFQKMIKTIYYKKNQALQSIGALPLSKKEIDINKEQDIIEDEISEEKIFDEKKIIEIASEELSIEEETLEIEELEEGTSEEEILDEREPEKIIEQEVEKSKKTLNLGIEPEKVEKLKKIMMVSDRIKIDIMSKLLKIDYATFNKIIEWSAEFGFTIQEGVLIINKKAINDFIAEINRLNEK